MSILSQNARSFKQNVTYTAQLLIGLLAFRYYIIRLDNYRFGYLECMTVSQSAFMFISRFHHRKEGKEIMVRSLLNRFGKWIVLAVVVLAFGMWFFLSNGQENYAEKYEGLPMDVVSQDIGRDNTYDSYRTPATHPLVLSSAEETENVHFYDRLGLLEDGTLLYGETLPADEKVTLTPEGNSFSRASNVLWVNTGASTEMKLNVQYSGYYRVSASCVPATNRSLDMATEVLLDGAPLTAEENYELYLMPGEHTVTFTAAQSPMLLVSAALNGPYRDHRAEETAMKADVSVALETVEASDGVTFYPVMGITTDGAFLEEADIATAAEGTYAKIENAVLTQSGSSAQWTIDVPTAGFYNVELTYLTGKSRGVDIERGLLINGQLPFDGADTMNFSRLWKDEGTLKVDENGQVVLDQDGFAIRLDANGNELRTHDNQHNQIRPAQVEIFGESQTAFCRDSMGYITEPYGFYFEKGQNTITLLAESEPMVLTAISLKVPTDRQSYETYLASVGEKEQNAALADAEPIVIEGENSTRRSSPSLYARYDRSSSATSPQDVSRTVLNYIGGDAWRDAGQWIEWEFNVPEAGWYNITVKGRQTYSRGAVSSRIVYVDNQVLFDEMDNLGFQYSSSWDMNTLCDAEGNPCRIWLEPSEKPHTIRLEATLGDMGPILSRMEESVYRLNAMYRKILVLTGVTPDQYRDYHLDEKYPEVIEEMRRESRRLYKLVDDAVAITNQKSDRIAAVQTLAVQLELFADDPDEITQAFANFKDNITSVGTSMLNLRQVQLDIDQIVITADGNELPECSESFFSRAWHEIVSCVTSYTVDYNALGDVHEGDDVLEVWIVTGRDQSNVLKTMVDDTFTAQTGIPVNVMLVDASALLNATVAGNGPDVVVSTDSWNPVNYAMRGAAENVKQFDADFVQKHIVEGLGVDPSLVLPWDQVLCEDNFYESAYRAFQYTGKDGKEGIYALPETQLCSIMFYRSDILEEYNLPLPKTWDDLIAMLPTLQGANMSVGIPYPDIVNPNLSAFYAMIYQRGGKIYEDDATMTAINSEEAIKAFEMYTSLYNDYGLPTIFDFVSRFRSGEMPIGIFDYTTYNTLNVSAPEIRGLWEIAVLPGTIVTDKDGNRVLDENGNPVINHAGHSQGACTMMIAGNSTEMKARAWTFMQWWVSADAQVRFGREIESILGPSSRYATANRKAISQLAWSEEQLEVIRDQMSVAIGFREVAGGYYTTRHLTNAVRKVTNEKTDPRETLLDYARTINEEIVKKREEFGLYVPQAAIDATKNAMSNSDDD